MNAAQVLRMALFLADAVNQDGTTDPYWSQAELLALANDAKDKAEMALRQAKEDFHLLTMQSDDTAFRWGNIDYDPSVMELNATHVRYKLPPDLITLKSIRPITEGYEWIKFTKCDMSNQEFKDAQALSVTTTTDEPILWDVVGENTLVLACAPASTIDIEIAYIARSQPLQLYSPGTVTLVNGSTSVSGGSTAWSDEGIHTNCDLIVSADSTAPKIVGTSSTGTWVNPSSIYFPVSTIDSDGGLTLGGNWLAASASGRGYMLASVPEIPPEHHMQIVHLLVEAMKLKDKNLPPQAFAQAAERGAKMMAKDVTARQLDQIPVSEDWVANVQ
jgi:hypothetical protein